MEFSPQEKVAFGTADLSNCEREQIQLAGSIQPHGALLVLGEKQRQVVQASANAADFLGLSGDILDRTISEINQDLATQIDQRFGDPAQRIPIALRCHMGQNPGLLDCLAHRPYNGGLVVELERAGPSTDLPKLIEQKIQRILVTTSIKALCEETAKLFKEITGYDRVMVYRFEPEGHGEVFAESKEAHLEAYLGNRYPASDIPQIARRLYERNRIRLLVDVNYDPIPIVPRFSPSTEQDLDMSLCFLRSMSPIHLQYLKNMGVSGTLVISLMVGGELWGLIACHHYSPKLVPYEERTACELLAETVAIRIAALESFAHAQAEVTARRLEQRMIDAIPREGDWRSALFDSPEPLMRSVEADGVALLFEDQVMTVGEVPSTQQVRKVGSWLTASNENRLYATNALAKQNREFATFTPIASGLLAVPVSNAQGEYLMWFRRERIRTITWAGNPAKPMEFGDDPRDLSPRRSFAKWHQIVEGTSEPWTPVDLTTGRLISDSLRDIVLQFRSVRLLIAQNQLENISKQIGKSLQPLIIADDGGRILLSNKSFAQLFQLEKLEITNIDDLCDLFSDPAMVKSNLAELRTTGRVWRAEVNIRGSAGSERSILVRADPVMSPRSQVIGYVILLTDLSESKAVEGARRRFQEKIIEQHRIGLLPLNSEADLTYRNLISSVVGNAQLAALEITDGLDATQIPPLLESVQKSVSRTSELLEHLIWHATDAKRDQTGDD